VHGLDAALNVAENVIMERLSHISEELSLFVKALKKLKICIPIFRVHCASILENFSQFQKILI